MSRPELAGRHFLVTGANTGIGRATAQALVARGGSVVLAGRSEAKTRPIVDELQRAGGAADFLLLDLADLAQVKQAAESFLASGRKLDVLINNAGLIGARGLTRDGLEIAIGTNHVGPFLFTRLLLPRLLEAPQGRIVNVASSSQHNVRTVDWSWFRRATNGARDRLATYSLSKLMNVLHARELARRLASTRVTTYALHPGVVASDVWRSSPPLVAPVIKLFMISAEEGALTSIHCATAPELATTSGRYYVKCQEVRVNPLADDTGLGRELFERTEQAIAGA